MSSVLVLYASHDGQTRRIAERMRDVVAGAGHKVTLRAFDGPAACDEIARHDAVIVGAAIRYGHHDRRLEKQLRARAGSLSGRPNAFFSVCLCAGGPGAKPEAVRRYLDEFVRNTGWQPADIASIAGALQYTRYPLRIKLIIKLIMVITGGETDSSRDYEYTDWVAVERFAKRFVERLSVPEAA